MENINLDELKSGFPGISSRVGAFLAEGCAVCLENNGHQSSTIIKISGDYEQ